MQYAKLIILLVMLLNLGIACNGKPMNEAPSSTYTLNGVVVSLEGEVTLSDGAGNQLITGDGNFRFDNDYQQGQSFDLQIITAPADVHCQIENGSGTFDRTDITNVKITCLKKQNQFKLTINVNGLKGTLVIQDQTSGVSKTIENDGEPVFKDDYFSEDKFGLVVESQPEGQNCIIEGGEGQFKDINLSVDIKCVNIEFEIKVSTKGLIHHLYLGNEDNEVIFLDGNTKESFKKKYKTGTSYKLSILSEPVDQLCYLEDHYGEFSDSDIELLIVCEEAIIPVTQCSELGAAQ